MLGKEHRALYQGGKTLYFVTMDMDTDWPRSAVHTSILGKGRPIEKGIGCRRGGLILACNFEFIKCSLGFFRVP